MLPGEKGIVEAQIEGWVKQHVVYPDRAKLGKCTKVVLSHLNVERKKQGDVAVIVPQVENGEYDHFLREVAEAAQGDANDLRAGVQTYALYAHYELDRNTVVRKMFRVAAEDSQDVERDIRPSEPATEAGLVAQTMRHNEAIMRATTVQMGYLVQTMQAEMRRISEMNEKFMQTHVDTMVLVQDALDGSHRRRLEERAEEANLAMKDAAFSKIDTLLPVLINRIAGSQVLPEEDKSLMLMAQLLEGLTDVQQQQLLATLTDTQRILLAEVMATYEKKKSRWMANQAKLSMAALPPNALPPATSPSAGAAPASSTEARLQVPIPLASPVRDRLGRTEQPSSDPVMRKLEEDGAAFTRRFRNFLDDPKPQGDT